MSWKKRWISRMWARSGVRQPGRRRWPEAGWQGLAVRAVRAVVSSASVMRRLASAVVLKVARARVSASDAAGVRRGGLALQSGDQLVFDGGQPAGQSRGRGQGAHPVGGVEVVQPGGGRDGDGGVDVPAVPHLDRTHVNHMREHRQSSAVRTGRQARLKPL